LTDRHSPVRGWGTSTVYKEEGGSERDRRIGNGRKGMGEQEMGDEEMVEEVKGEEVTASGQISATRWA
jgi:hypothetical protein